MPVLQYTMDFTCRGYGWSESWYKQSEAVSLKAFIGTIGIPLLNKRNAMCAFETTIDAHTVSSVDVPGDSFLTYTGFTQGGLGTEIHGASPHEAVMTTVRSDNDRRRRNVWLRGIPDDVVQDGGVFKPAYAPWVAPATVFMDALVQGGWGWVSLVRNPLQYDITDYAMDPVTLYVEFTFAGNPFAGVTIGEFRKVRMLFKGQKSKLNGYQVVEITGANSARSLKPTAVFPFTKPGKMRLYTPTFYAMTNWSFQKQGERRAGRPKLHTPGRGREQPRG